MPVNNWIPEAGAGCGLYLQPRQKWKLAIASLVALAALCVNGCGSAIPGLGPQNGVVGKWRSTDGSYVAEFLPNGNCTAHERMQGHDLGGPCTYTVDQDTITIHYYGLGANPHDGAPNETAIWHYTLDGDTLNVSVFAVSMTLKRTH